jgi:hypothetical protein
MLKDEIEKKYQFKKKPTKINVNPYKLLKSMTLVKSLELTI